MSAPVVDAFLRYSWDCGDQGIGADISRDNNIRGDDCPVTDRDIRADHRAVADSNGAAVDHDTVEVAVEVGACVDIGATLALKSVLKVDVRACSPRSSRVSLRRPANQRRAGWRPRPRGRVLLPELTATDKEDDHQDPPAPGPLCQLDGFPCHDWTV